MQSVERLPETNGLRDQTSSADLTFEYFLSSLTEIQSRRLNLLYGTLQLKDPLLSIEKSNPRVAAEDFLSHCQCGYLPYARHQHNCNKAFLHSFYYLIKAYPEREESVRGIPPYFKIWYFAIMNLIIKNKNNLKNKRN